MLDDLPAPVGGGLMLDDLEIPDAIGPMLDDLPASVSTPGFMDDLPTPDGPPLDLMGDLPAPDTDAFEFDSDDFPTGVEAVIEIEDDLPVAVDQAPSLMDDLPVAFDDDSAPSVDDGLSLEELPLLEASDDPFASVIAPGPKRLDSLELAEDAGVDLRAVTPRIVQPPLDPASPGLGTKPPKTRKAEAGPGGRRASFLLLLLLVGVGAALVQFGPEYLGIDVLAMVGEFRGKAADRARGPETAETPATPGPTAPKAPPSKPVAAVLTPENVDSLSYSQLRRATDAFATVASTEPQDKELVLWARYRLASVYGDQTAKEKLLADVPSRLDADDVGALAAAAGVGALLLQGKVAVARRTAERLRRAKHKDSPRLAYVAGLAVAAQAPKAQKLYERVLVLAPDLVDARLALGSLQLGSRDPETGEKLLLALAKRTSNPDVGLRAAMALDAAGLRRPLLELIHRWPGVDQIEDVSPERRGEYERLLCRGFVVVGDLPGAVAATAKRVEHDPQSVDAAIELARLQIATGGNAANTLATAFGRLEKDEDKARILAEQIRVAIAAKDKKAATELIASGADLPVKATGGWLKLSEGWLAESEGRAAAAKAAYNAATRGRPNFGEAKLAQILLEPGPPAAAISKLTQLVRQTDLPAAKYHLALAMADRGNPGGALELIEEVVWRDPTVVEPTAVVLGWFELNARAGELKRAMTLAETFHKTRPDDQRPVKLLIEMAEKTGDANLIANWYRVLVQQDPDNYRIKAALAAQLMDAGRDGEARTLLDEVQNNPDAKHDAEALYQLGRAWAKRDPIKARGFLIEARAIEPSAKIYYLLGVIDQGREKTDTALEAYQEALNLDPNLTEARFEVAKIQLAKGKYKKAEKELRLLLNRDPSNARIAELLGDALRDMDKASDALKAYQKALDAHEKPSARLLLKVAKLQSQNLGQIGPAVRTLKLVVVADPKSHEAYYMLGYALKDMGRPEEAIDAFERYLKCAPADEIANEVKTDLEDLRGRQQ